MSDTPDAPAEPDPSPGVPPALLASWRAAEERLYPMVMVVPEGYERVVRLVGETAVELQLACPDVASLVAEAPRVADRVRRLAEAAGVYDVLDYALIGASALLLRYRQVDEQLRRDQQVTLIEEAAAAGQTWVVLARGAPPTTWPPMPSTTLEMHVASGSALEQTVLLDLESGAPLFLLRCLSLDPATGERRGGEATEESFEDLASWQAATAARRSEIERGPSDG